VILIDTGPLVALCDERDSRYEIAIERLEELAKADLAICDAILGRSLFPPASANTAPTLANVAR
jgi:predicted nucleic acid-binding protein